MNHNAHRLQAVRTYLGRLHRICSMLSTSRFLTAREISLREEITQKTVYRDMDFLRDNLGWQIESRSQPPAGFRLVRQGAGIKLPR